MRFFVVSLASLGANLLVLHVLITLGAGKLVGQAIAIVARHAAELRRQQALVVPATAASRC